MGVCTSVSSNHTASCNARAKAGLILAQLELDKVVLVTVPSFLPSWEQRASIRTRVRLMQLSGPLFCMRACLQISLLTNTVSKGIMKTC